MVIVSPTASFLGGVLPFRWILLLTYPLSFYAVEGFFAIKWNWQKVVYKIALGFIIALLTVSFMILPNSGASGYFGAYPTYVPKSMLQNTHPVKRLPRYLKRVTLGKKQYGPKRIPACS